MFDAFSGQRRRSGERGRQALALGVGTGTWAAMVAAATGLGGAGAAPAPPAEAPIAVVFAPPPPTPPPPPPEPAAPAPPPAAPPVAAPKHLRRKPPDPARPPRALEAPTKIPDGKPEEKDASDFAVAAAPPGEGDAAGREGGTGIPGEQVAAIAADAKPAPARRPSRPVQLTERMTPPRQLTTTRPVFPEAARAAGRDGLVVLKIAIDEEGRVIGMKLMKGEEPFVSAAVAWAKALRFDPARDADGRRIAVFRTLRIPFELRNI